MIKNRYLILLFGFWFVQLHCSVVDFDQSMKIEQHSELFQYESLERLFSIFKRLYKKNNFDVAPSKIRQTVPKLFHYIWFGSKLPRKFIPFLQSWIEKHPDWKFLIWVDNPQNYDLAYLVEDADFDKVQVLIESAEGMNSNCFVIDVKHLDFKNRIFFDEARNFGERSDILRYELLYRFGGVYIDVDMECLYPLNFLHEKYDFYTGLQPLDTEMLQLGIGLIGARPGHPVLEHAVETIGDNRDQGKIVVRTGPIHFTKSFLSTIGKTEDSNIVLPASYFYPCDYNQVGLPAHVWKKPESIAVHHWAGSWL